MKALGEIARRRGVMLLADAAQAHGVDLGGVPSAFSFYLPRRTWGHWGTAGPWSRMTLLSRGAFARWATMGHAGSIRMRCAE